LDSSTLPQNQSPLPQPEVSTTQTQTGRDQAKGFKIVPFVKEVFRRFGEDNGPLIAAALSFFTLVSFVPILLVAVSGLGYFMKSSEAQHRVIEIASGFMPALASTTDLKKGILDLLTQLVTGPKTTIGIVGLLGLIWSGSALFLNMEVALNSILDVESKRGFIKARLVALGTMALLAVLLLASVAITSAMSFIEAFRIPIANFTPGDLPFVFDLLGFLIPVFISFAMFYAVYKIVPNARIEPKAAMVAAAFAAVFFEIAKHGFGWYAGHFGNFNKVYGTLGIIVFLVTWTLYSYMILLIGAEVADVYSEKVLGKPVVREQSKDEKDPKTGAVPHS